MIVRELYFRVLAATLMLFSATMHVLYALSHLQDLSTTSANGLQDYNSTLSLRAAKFRREKNIDRVTVAKMQNAGLNTTSMDPEVLSLMPKWSEIETAIVPGPRILGLDTCKAFQAIVADNDRYVGGKNCAGPRIPIAAPIDQSVPSSLICDAALFGFCS